MEWEVWLADGTVMDSRRHVWSDVPDRILVVRWWDGPAKGVHWGDSIYGDPATWKAGEIVADELFQQVFHQAQETRTPPSKR